jgi:tetratricopeptide (TPR) repeat protein
VAVALVVLLVLVSGCATLGLVESVAALIEQGKALFEAKRYDEALAKFQEVIKREPGSWTAYLYAARSYIAKGVWPAAVEHGRKAFELAPTQPDVVPVFGEALVGGGRDALTRGDYAGAIGRFTEYVRLKPTDAHGYLDLGRAYLASGRYADALPSLLNGLGQSGDAGVQRELTAALLDGGRRALSAGDLSGGIGFLKEYVQRDPSHVAAYLDLGKAYWQNGQSGEALGAFRRVLELQPGQPDALRFLLGTPGR